MLTISSSKSGHGRLRGFGQGYIILHGAEGPAATSELARKQHNHQGSHLFLSVVLLLAPLSHTFQVPATAGLDGSLKGRKRNGFFSLLSAPQRFLLGRDSLTGSGRKKATVDFGFDLYVSRGVRCLQTWAAGRAPVLSSTTMMTGTSADGVPFMCHKEPAVALQC